MVLVVVFCLRRRTCREWKFNKCRLAFQGRPGAMRDCGAESTFGNRRTTPVRGVNSTLTTLRGWEVDADRRSSNGILWSSTTPLRTEVRSGVWPFREPFSHVSPRNLSRFGVLVGQGLSSRPAPEPGKRKKWIHAVCALYFGWNPPSGPRRRPRVLGALAVCNTDPSAGKKFAPGSTFSLCRLLGRSRRQALPYPWIRSCRQDQSLRKSRQNGLRNGQSRVRSRKHPWYRHHIRGKPTATPDPRVGFAIRGHSLRSRNRISDGTDFEQKVTKRTKREAGMK
jgi:hypothetical protein